MQATTTEKNNENQNMEIEEEKKVPMKKARVPKVVKPKRPPHMQNIDIIAWRVAAKMCGYLAKGKKEEVGGGFQKIPKTGTPEHARIKEKQVELIHQWEEANEIPEEFRNKRSTDDGTEEEKTKRKRKRVSKKDKKKGAETDEKKAEPEPVVVSQTAEFKVLCANCKCIQTMQLTCMNTEKPPVVRKPRKKKVVQAEEPAAVSDAEAETSA